ncbi:hypothetical protein BD309DRAFT_346143 [Dichomitus squalens]|nr:hypothetical protein BD309DRAFT_346143 [Dichomitus squalens]
MRRHLCIAHLRDLKNTKAWTNRASIFPALTFFHITLCELLLVSCFTYGRRDESLLYAESPTRRRDTGHISLYTCHSATSPI